MIRKILAITLCIYSFGVYAQSRVDTLLLRLQNPKSDYVFVVAHRADWRNFPENSLPAIESAINMGVDIIELDVQRTKDGKLILMHDGKLDRTTTGKGNVSDFTFEEIKALKLKNGCNIKTKEIVPTLEEALLLIKDRVIVNLDKADRYFDEVYALLEKTGTTRQIIMKGGKSASEVMKQFGNYLDKVIYMPIVHLDKEDVTEHLDSLINFMNPIAFELVYASDTCQMPLRVKDKLSGKTLIWYNTLWDTLSGGCDDDAALDSPDNSYGYLINTLGARILQTDRPAYLIEYLKKSGFRK